MAELMGFSPKEEDEPFIELFSECRFLSSIHIDNFVPQLLAVKAQGRKDMFNKTLCVKMSPVFLRGERRR